MKANIEQLAKQAGLSTQYIEYFGPKLLEQFAKVIAKECIDQIPKDMSFYDRNRAVDSINQHFVQQPVKEKITLAKAKEMGRKDFAHSECPEDCRKCEHFGECVYPIMD